MLKEETLKLLNSYDIDFKNVFSICIGKTFLYQKRFIDYIGKYNNWNTNLEEGILKLGAKGVVEIDDQLKIILGADAKKLKKYIDELK